MAAGKFDADFQRLEELKKYLGMSYQEIAGKAGIKTAQSFYSVKAGKQGVTKMMARAISSTWPEISEAWLLSGRGSMVENKDHESNSDEKMTTIERKVLDTIISQQETIRIQAATIQDLARQKGVVTARQESSAECAAAG